MPIQLIIFLTKNKIFASEINNNGQADTISINGNSDIKCEGKESVDELIECIFEAFSIDSFGDDHFDIVIVDCGGDKKFISYLNAKCEDAVKLNVISFEKLLPLLVWNKKQLASGEEVVVAFADACYKVACDDKKVVRFTGKARKGKENVTLELDDFGCLYYFNVENLQGGVVDTSELQNKDNVIAKLEEENDKLMRILNEKENALAVALATVKNAENKIVELNTEIKNLKEKYPEPTDGIQQMLKIVQSSKKILDKETCEDWDFAIKGTISKNKLNGAIKMFNSMLKRDIDVSDTIALFTIYTEGFFGNDTKNILCTSKGIFYDGIRSLIDNCWELPLPGFLEWNEISVFKVIDEKEMEVVAFGMPRMRFSFGCGLDSTVMNELVSMMNKLKDVDI